MGYGMRRGQRWTAVLAVAFVAAISTAAWGQESAAKPNLNVNIFDHYFIQGGPIVWFILLPLSMVIVSMGIMFGMKYRRVNLLPTDEIQRVVDLLEARQYRQAIEETGKSHTLISYALHKALSSASMGYLVMERSLEDAVDGQTAQMSSKIEPLNIIGNVGPLLGLFGTVVGMIHTFAVIVSTGGTPNAAQLAGGISEALVCTAWGLIVAVPGLAVYGVLRNRLDIIANEAALKGQEVLNLFRGGMMNKPAAAGAAGAAAPPPPAGKPAVAGQA